MSLFTAIEEAPRDPILGINELFNADTHAEKINLSIGVYLTDEGKIPLLKSVHNAEQLLIETAKPHAYLPINGSEAYNHAVQELIFGKDAEVVHSGRVVTVQSLGGTGGLKIGADFLKRFFPNTTVAISDPSWENHRALFESAGFPVTTYSYYDAKTHALDFNGMLSSLNKLPVKSIVILHACCHNPTGIDLNTEQWQQVIELCKTRELIPFLDMAYQGFAYDVETDAKAVRLFADSGLSVLVSNSFSKSFSLYGERVGALSIVTEDKNESVRVLSQIKRIIRTNYSNPPSFGAAIVTTILTRPELRTLWESELTDMRQRIQAMRHELVARLNPLSPGFDFSFINQQQGMFSYSGLTTLQVEKLRQHYGIYVLSTGRLCIAALNSRNISTVAQAIGQVLTPS